MKLHVEQMPGMEVAGDWPGATKENTVCLLHKCLEGLKQAGHVWQINHTATLLAIRLLTAGYRFTQTTTDPCLFILHCSIGIIAVLVWVDDILIGFKGQVLYDAFSSYTMWAVLGHNRTRLIHAIQPVKPCACRMCVSIEHVYPIL